MTVFDLVALKLPRIFLYSAFNTKIVTNISHAAGLECFQEHGLMSVLALLGEQ